MATPSPEAGPHRNPDELSHLTVDMLMPLDPVELAMKHDAGTLHGYAMGEIAIAEGLSQKASELRAQLSVLDARVEDVRHRAAAYVTAMDIANGDANGS